MPVMSEISILDVYIKKPHFMDDVCCFDCLGNQIFVGKVSKNILSGSFSHTHIFNKCSWVLKYNISTFSGVDGPGNITWLKNKDEKSQNLDLKLFNPHHVLKL